MRRSVGFLVWNPARSLPSRQHETFAQAVTEAARLRVERPDETFWVMGPVHGEKAAKAAQAFSDGKAEGMAQAHAEIMLAEGKTDRLLDERAELRRSLEHLSTLDERRVEFQAIVADCMTWFAGFEAAHLHKESWDRPWTPDREQLRALNVALQALLRRAAEDEIPF